MMIAATDRRAVGMVTLYRSRRGFLGGNTEPVDWHSGTSLDVALAAMGYRRTGEWEPAPGRPGEHLAPVARV